MFPVSRKWLASPCISHHQAVAKMALLLFTLLLAYGAAWSTAAPQSSEATITIEGKIFSPDGTGKLPPETEVQLTLESGRVLVTFPTPDGRFKVPWVPDGVHTLDVYASNWVYPAVKLVTGAGQRNPVIASLPELPTAPTLPYPLLLRPAAKAEYFEKRKPFNVIGFLKTPYGMMGAFMVFSMFLLPKLKVDPEEYRQVMQTRGEDAPAPDRQQRRRD